MKRFLLVVSLLYIASGCRTVDNGVCPAPNSNIEWFLVVQPGPPGFGSNYWCVMCDSSVTDNELEAWASENVPDMSPNGCAGYPEGECPLTPCLYVYSNDSFDNTTVEGCRANICSETPNSNDMVSTAHGAWESIGPILNGDLVGHNVLHVPSQGMDNSPLRPHLGPEMVVAP